MRRRAADFRRPARRRLSEWMWWLLAAFLIAGLLLFVVHHNYQTPPFAPPLQTSTNIEEAIRHSLNFTHELLSATSPARQLADQITLAKAYVVIAKEHGNLQLAWEFSSHIRKSQRLLSQAAVRGKPIPLEEAYSEVHRLSELIYKTQDLHYDISTTITTLKSHVQALEGRVIAATVQSAAFGKLASESMPKNLHCLDVKLTVDWFRNPSFEKVVVDQRNSPRLVDNNLYHFCIFSDNVLATAVVVNSTISNADHPQQLVFHIVTDPVSYWSMAAWFLKNNFRGSTVHVRNIKEFAWLNSSYSPLVKQLSDDVSQTNYFGGASQDQNGETKFRSKYTLLLNHLRFYIPELHPDLERVVFLDDDVVVQKDLTPLFSLDLHGNVIGAVETCLEASHRFYKYLNFSNPLISSKFDPQACGWGFGMNVFDLIAWKKANLTAKYHYWQEQNYNRMLWKAGTLPPGLLTFYGLIEPLDRRWHVLGLGYDMDIDDRLLETAAAVHFSGSMKPWLKLGISRYRHLWQLYINITHPFLLDCSMH